MSANYSAQLEVISRNYLSGRLFGKEKCLFAFQVRYQPGKVYKLCLIRNLKRLVWDEVSQLVGNKWFSFRNLKLHQSERAERMVTIRAWLFWFRVSNRSTKKIGTNSKWNSSAVLTSPRRSGWFIMSFPSFWIQRLVISFLSIWWSSIPTKQFIWWYPELLLNWSLRSSLSKIETYTCLHTCVRACEYRRLRKIVPWLANK